MKSRSTPLCCDHSKYSKLEYKNFVAEKQKKKMEERIPPHDLDAEQSVLGSMMISRDAVTLAASKLKPEYFYRDAHTAIYNAILKLYHKNEPIDLVTVSSQLKKDNELENVGGRVYLADVVNSVPTAANVEKYANIVTEKGLLRRLIDTGSHIIKESFDASGEVDEVIELAQKNILDISQERVRYDFVKLEDVLKTVFDDIQSVFGTEDKIMGVPTGFPDLDKLTSGFQKSDLIILAARPAMGKTTLALNFAVNAAVTHKIPVAIFSLEMPKEQLAMRLLSSEAKIDTKRLRTANLHEHEYKGLMQALGKLSEAPIYIDDAPGISPMELRAKFRRLKAEADIQLILIDYMQLMRGGKKRSENRFQEVSEIVREVKGFAKEAQVPIIALSQLSREVEKRQDKRPQLSDLRESGEFEQTADIVMFIHRDDYYQSPTGEGHPGEASITELIIAKHRNGPTGSVKLMFRKHLSKFISADQSYAVPQ